MLCEDGCENRASLTASRQPQPCRSHCHERDDGQAVKVSGIGSGPGETAVDVVVVNHPSPASPTGSKWEKASCMDELVLKSSASKEIDRFLT